MGVHHLKVSFSKRIFLLVIKRWFRWGFDVGRALNILRHGVYGAGLGWGLMWAGR